MLTRLKRYLATAILLGMGGWTTVDAWKEIRTGQRLSQEGVFTEGKVLQHFTSYRSKDGHKYRLTVEFTPTNHIGIVQTFKVPADVYHPAVKTRSVKVRYLPEDPAICAAGEKVDISYQWLVWGLFEFLGGIYLLWFYRDARRQLAKLCVEEHQFETVNAVDYPHLDLAFYEEGRRILETHGYRFLADREDLTVRRDQGLRIAIRCLVSRDTATVAGLYHLRLRWFYRWLGAKDSRVIDLETRFANGDWVITTNAQAAGALEQPPGIHALFLPLATSLETVIEAHASRVALYQDDHPDTAPCRVATLDDVTRLGADLQLRKAQHRRATGLTQAELQRMTGTPASAELAIVHDGIMAGFKPDQKKAV